VTPKGDGSLQPYLTSSKREEGHHRKRLNSKGKESGAPKGTILELFSAILCQA